jgi:N-acyl-L-homoserine lactone synthetase
MLYLIDPDNYHLHKEDLDNMYRLRHKVFFEKMNWQVSSKNGMEKDEYDENDMYYLIYKDEKGIIRGCVRFIEMTNNCMFDGPFKFALPNVEDFKKPRYWELSRLAVDCDYDDTYTTEMSQHISLNLISGYLYFGLELEQIECTLTISYPQTLELYKSYGLLFSQLSRITLNEETHEEIVVSGFPSLNYCYDKMVKGMKIDTNVPVLWHLGPMFKYSENFKQPSSKLIIQGV